MMRAAAQLRYLGLLAVCLAAPLAARAEAVPAGAVRVPAFERTVLPNGLTLVVMRKPDVPLVAFSLVLRGGARAEPAERAGVASLTAGLLEKGAGARNAFEFADAVANVGGSFNASAGAETLRIGGQFLARDRELMLELLADALLRPRFEAREFEQLRTRQIELIKAAKDSDPSALRDTYGRAFLFAGHPYARPVDGSERSLAALSVDDVRAYARTQFGADRAILVITGDVDPAWARKAVRARLGGWARAAGTLPPLPEPTRTPGRRVLLVDAPGSTQTYFWIGSVGVARRDPERAALDIVNTLFGGRFTSILNTELRIKSGLSYGASSGFTRGSVPGEFSIESFTLAENTQRAVDLAFETLERLHRDGVDPAQLESARAYVLGQYPLGYETAAQWAGALADLEYYGLGREDIESYGPRLAAVDAAAVQGVIARAFPRAADVVLVLIGDAAQLRSVAAGYGPVTELPLAGADFSAAR